jgi:ATP-dependent RNA helicase DeaD
MRRGSISLGPVSMVVLDEADEMLDMGFREDIEFILGQTSPERQTVMFSATMSKDILSLTNKFQKDPVVIDVTSQKINAPIIDQMSFEISERSKPEAVARLIDYYDIKLALVFCNTKSKVDDLVEVLKTRGYFAEGLHGDMSQKQREKVMGGFKNGTVEILVATDVAGRGIDVNDIAAVFNYDLPRDDEDYIHRIGRTGRAGKSGKSFTFVTGREVYNLRRIERSNGIKITRGTIPSIDDLDSTMIKSYGEKVKTLVEKGALSRYVRIVESLIEDEYTSLDVAAVLLKLAMDGKSEGYDDTQTFEPQAARKSYDRGSGRDSGRERSGSRRSGTGGSSFRRSGGSSDRGRDSRRGSGRDSAGSSGRDFGRDSKRGSSRDSGRSSGRGDSRPKSGSFKGKSNSETSSGFPGWSADNRDRFADKDTRPSKKDSTGSGRSEKPRSEKPRSASSKSSKDNAGDKWWSTFDKGSKLIKAGSDKKKKKRKE